MNFLLSLVLGLLPEIIYFVMLTTRIKNIKTKRIKLFLLLATMYILCIMLFRYKLLLYVVFIFIYYLILKILYKKEIQIIDIFFIMYQCLYLTILSFLVYLYNNDFQYYICLVVNRILLFVPLIFTKRLQQIYYKYCLYWNRNDNIKKPIKSITLRNISILGMNLIIVLIYIISLYILSNVR